MLAAIFEAPRLGITDDEAQRLAETFARVARWYDFPEISEKITDHYAFATAVIMVYGTRIAAEIADRRRGRAPLRTVSPTAGPQPAATSPGNGATAPPEGSGVREPPDPRNWRKVDVDGLGTIDIPPVSPTPQ
jgi:hypothetical protein